MSEPANYPSGAGYHAPPGQGHDPRSFPPPPTADGYNDAQYDQGYRSPPPQHASYDPQTGHPIPPGYVPPHRPPPGSYDHNNFPPPPRDNEYRGDGYDEGPPPPRSEYGRGYDRAPPSDYGPPHSQYGYNERPYAPSDPYVTEGNQLAPFDEEKAEAEERRRWEEEEQRRRYQVPPPPSDSELRERHRDRYDDRDRDRDRRYDDRDYDDQDRDRRRRSYSDERSSYDDRDRRRYDDKRDRRDSRRSETKNRDKDIFGGKEGERGFGAQILGGAAGGLAGHEFGKGGMLETLGGIVVGAVGAKVFENQHEKRKNKKDEAMRREAPYKSDAVSGRRGTTYPVSGMRRDGDRRERRESQRLRSPSRSRSRRSGRRRGGSESDSYSSEGSMPPPRRQQTY